MPRFGRCPWRLVLAFGLLGLVMAGPAAMRAEALGCHAEDRPALGLDGEAGVLTAQIQRLVYPDIRAVRPAPRLGRPPCSQELPGSVPGTANPPPIVFTPMGLRPERGPGIRLPGTASHLLGANPHSRALERPPRPNESV